jgi:hypothetical protein
MRRVGITHLFHVALKLSNLSARNPVPGASYNGGLDEILRIDDGELVMKTATVFTDGESFANHRIGAQGRALIVKIRKVDVRRRDDERVALPRP